MALVEKELTGMTGVLIDILSNTPNAKLEMLMGINKMNGAQRDTMVHEIQTIQTEGNNVDVDKTLAELQEASAENNTSNYSKNDANVFSKK